MTIDDAVSYAIGVGLDPIIYYAPVLSQDELDARHATKILEAQVGHKDMLKRIENKKRAKTT